MLKPFWLVNTIFFHFFRQQWKWKTMVENFPARLLFWGNPASFFSVQWKIIVQGNRYFCPKETEFRANNGFHKQKKAVNKIIPFPIDINSDSTSQNKEFIKKIRFHYAGKLLSPAGISKKNVKIGFQLSEKGYSIKNCFTLI